MDHCIFVAKCDLSFRFRSFGLAFINYDGAMTHSVGIPKLSEGTGILDFWAGLLGIDPARKRLDGSLRGMDGWVSSKTRRLLLERATISWFVKESDNCKTCTKAVKFTEKVILDHELFAECSSGRMKACLYRHDRMQVSGLVHRNFMHPSRDVVIGLSKAKLVLSHCLYELEVGPTRALDLPVSLTLV